MTKHKRILVPVKLTASPDYAFVRALEMAQRSGSELYLLHAVPLTQTYQARAAQRLKRFADLRRRAAAAGVAVQTIEQQGPAADVIVLHADARPIDLIVMSSGRRKGWSALREPSVTESVLRRTIRPTMIVRDDRDGGAIKNVLAAIERSPDAVDMLGRVIAMPGIDVRRLTIVHAVDGDAVDEARRELSVMMQGVETTAPIAIQVSRGAADDVIGSHLAAIDADLIAIGRSKRLLQFGSTARRLLRTTDRALLIVPPAVRDAASHKRAA